MSLGRNIAFGLYLVTVLFCLVCGLIYLFRKEFLPYHADVVATSWNKIDARFQALTIALLRASGGGLFCYAVAMSFILFIPFRNGEAWANWALLTIGLAESIPTLIATLVVKRNANANLTLLCILLILAGFFTGLVFSK